MSHILKLSLTVCLLILINQPLAAQSNDPAGDDRYIVDLTAMEFSFELPSKIKSGWVTFRFKNEGSLTHVAQILKLEHDLSSAEVDSILQAGDYPATTKVMGGPGLHSGGESSEITIQLEPGVYMMVCGTRMKNDIPHFDLGMISHLEVTEEIGAKEPPTSDVKLTLDNYDIKMDGVLSTGRQTIEIDGNEAAYDVHLIALEEESTEAAAFEYFNDLQDPTPVRLYGGVEEGHISYYTVNIKPGDYLLSSHEYGIWGMHEKFSLSNQGDFTLKDKGTKQQVEIKTADYGISVPEEISSARTLVTIHNTGNQDHQLEIWKLQDGMGSDDWIHWMTSDKKDHEEGHHNHTAEFPGKGYGITFESLRPGKEHALTLELSPGRYVAVCYAENDEGNYHIEEGEIVEFIVE
ncbi:hypothetical protein ACKGJO_12665 [Gracilimonas sp. Q87]|uniref:hypothetical protein n=1 Tax=Gracilimonas sp. Q87 TaxID=3384766 RepID=UPI003983F62B